jgi:hypothetical protein
MLIYYSHRLSLMYITTFAGAVQCAKCCTRCRVGVWQKTHRGMLNHWRNIHDGVCQLPKLHDNISGPENIIVSESCWCIKGINDDGTAAVDTGGGNWVPCTDRLNSIREHVAFLFMYIACSCILNLHTHSTKAGCFKFASQFSTARCSCSQLSSARCSFG